MHIYAKYGLNDLTIQRFNVTPRYRHARFPGSPPLLEGSCQYTTPRQGPSARALGLLASVHTNVTTHQRLPGYSARWQVCCQQLRARPAGHHGRSDRRPVCLPCAASARGKCLRYLYPKRVNTRVGAPALGPYLPRVGRMTRKYSRAAYDINCHPLSDKNCHVTKIVTTLTKISCID